MTTNDAPATRLVTTEAPGEAPRAGLLLDGQVHDLARATGVPADATMLGVLEDWDAARARIARVREDAAAGRIEGVALDRLRLLAPIPRPGSILCAGANYADHVAEMAAATGRSLGPNPKTLGLSSWHFLKASRSVVGPEAEVRLPAASRKVDWEVELAVVVGRRAKDLAVAEALSCVAGYTVANDLSARDLGPREGVPDASPFRYDWLAHKSFDGSCPLGPWIVPADEIADPMALPLSLSVNGAMKQDSRTAEMIYGIAEQIADLSRRMTLWPGDVILTGTPAGVGTARGEFLQPGDVVVARVAGIGELVTRIAR